MKITERTYKEEAFENLKRQGLTPSLARIFAARNIESKDELSDNLKDLIPPDSLLNIREAAVLLADAIQKREQITIVGDYDCDGATACAVALTGIGWMGGKADYIVPKRQEGYGLSPEISETAARKHRTKLLVTVDNGISSIDGVKRAVELGMKVLVTDHHLPGKELPADCVIVNPNQPGCKFPSKNLAGVGVIFYVLFALRQEMVRRGVFRDKTEIPLNQLLDLVALGTQVDVVPLDKNNRILVSQGLKRIREDHTCPGIAALFKVSDTMQKNASSSVFEFKIGPRINAAGRIDDTSVAIECLLTADERRAKELAEKLHQINSQRGHLEEGMMNDAKDKVARMDPKNRASICLADSSWHEGITGLLSGEIREIYYRPVIAFTADAKDANLLKGSGRSIPGLHLCNALNAVKDRLGDRIVHFGGHAMAAGLTIKKDGFKAFSEAFEAEVKKNLTREQLEQRMETDGPLDKKFLTLEFAEKLEKYVWGQNFPKPLFCDEFTVLKVMDMKGGIHKRLTLERDGRTYTGVRFKISPEEALLSKRGMRIRAVYRPEKNEFNGTHLQLKIDYFEAAGRA